MKITTSLRSAIASQMIAAMANGSAGSPKLEFYTGGMPSSMGGTITGTLLAELTLTNSAATQTNGVITFEPITEDSEANASGVAGWARQLDRDGGEVFYFTVSGPEGGGDIELNNTEIEQGLPLPLSSGSIVVGGA